MNDVKYVVTKYYIVQKGNIGDRGHIDGNWPCIGLCRRDRGACKILNVLVRV